VIRQKLANMAKQVEVTQAYIEGLVYRGAVAEKRGDDWFDSILRTGAEAGLAKVQATRTFEFCAREAAMIFGGSAYVTGNRVEHLYRQVLSMAIPGGADDVLIDSSARLALQGKL
jgi:alkylation response protein AidB-like acyl-CoA dehydrogenase